MAAKKTVKKVLSRKSMKSTKGGDGISSKAKTADKAYTAMDNYIKG